MLTDLFGAHDGDSKVHCFGDIYVAANISISQIALTFRQAVEEGVRQSAGSCHGSMDGLHEVN